MRKKTSRRGAGSLRSDLSLLRTGRDWRGRARSPRGYAIESGATSGWGAGETADRTFPTAWARTPAAGVVRNVLQRGVLKPYAWAKTRPLIEGLDLLDGVRGPVVFVSNHASHVDTPLILGALPRRLSDRTAVGAAADYFFTSPGAGAATALLFNAFPVDRFGARRGGPSLPAELIEDGWNILLYPEGTRSHDGWMGSFKLGAARLCLSTGIPAVPVAVRGTFAAMPRGRNLPVRTGTRLVVRFGRPLHPREGEGAPEFRNRMARHVAALWAEEDLGWYASLRAAEEGTLTVPEGKETALPVTATPVERGKPVAEWRRVWEATRPSPPSTRPKVWRDR
ncbi:lysophospholipid acyltransferase family protein [Streptomyces capparidis]